MNSPHRSILSRSLVCILLLAAGTNTQAGLSLQLDFIHNCYGHVFTLAPNLNTNGVGGNSAPVTYHQIYSPFTNFTGGFGPNSLNNRDDYSDTNFASFIHTVTNGVWKLVMNVGATNQHTYTFNVRVTGLTSNLFVNAVMDSPVDGATGVTPLPTFKWHGPTNTDSLFVYVANQDFSIFQYAFPNVTATNTLLPPSLPNGNYLYSANYTKDVSALVTISTPLDASNNPAPGWASTSQFDIGSQASISVVAPDSTNGHALVAHYAFDDSSNLGKDTSGNGNDINCYSYWGPLHTFSTNAVAGGGAIRFVGTSSLTPCGQSFTTWTNTFAHSFSVSFWIQTTNKVGNDGDNLYDYSGQSVIYADNNNQGATVGLVGGEVAFRTTDVNSNDDTLDSTQEVTTNHYVHIVATHDKTTGAKRIYINGTLDKTDFTTTNDLAAAAYVSLGGESSSAYNGLLDDVQIYTGVLNAAEVVYLYQNPGSNAPNLNLNGLVAHYTFDSVTNLGLDSSGNGYNLNYNGHPFGSGVIWQSNAIAGAGAAYLDGGSFLSYTSTPAPVLSALAGDFSVSVWVKTMQTFGNDYDAAYQDAGIVAADVPGLANDVIPMALTGGQIGFNTGGNDYGDDTINSTADINDGAYHHIVVTRTRATGEKDIYIDGVLNNSDNASTNLLNDPNLLAIGCQIDASVSDPSSASPNNFYQGLLDDLQVYSRTLGANEIAYLHSHPGAVVTGGISNAPVSVNMTLSIYREQDVNFGEIYVAFPGINSSSPGPITTNRIASPSGWFNGQVTTNSSGSGSVILNSLSDLIHECTNGLWTLYINEGDLTEQVFHFSVSVSGLTSNTLAKSLVLVPANGATGVATNTSFQWSGPANYSSLNMNVNNQSGTYSTNLPVSATNWPSPPNLPAGTNIFTVTYASNNFPGITFTTPVGSGSNTVASWTTKVDLYSTAQSQFIVGSVGQLFNVQLSGGNFKLSFTSVAGRTNYVEARTNLALGSWVMLTNFVGDGSLKQFSFSTNTVPTRFFRVRAQ